MSEITEKEVVQHLSDSVEFDFDEFEIVELENREEFKPLNVCDGGGGGCCGFPSYGSIVIAGCR